MNYLIRKSAVGVINDLRSEMRNMASAIRALKRIAAMSRISGEPDPLALVDLAIRKVPQYSEDLACLMNILRELLLAEMEDPVCNGCGLTALVGTEGGQSGRRGCKCDTQVEEDEIWRETGADGL